MKYKTNRLLSIFLTLVMAAGLLSAAHTAFAAYDTDETLMSASTYAEDTFYDGMEIGTRNENAGLLHIAIMADSHVGWTEVAQDKAFGNVISDAKKRGAEKILVVGDTIQSPSDRQYNMYNNAVRTYAGNTEIIESIGNHELRSFNDEQAADSEYFETLRTRWRTNRSTGVYFSQWIGNTHIVALGSDVYRVNPDTGKYDWTLAYISDEELDWLERIVKNDYKNGVTTIIMCHWAVGNTYPANSYSTGQSFFDDPNTDSRIYNLVADHSNVIYFSGDTHASHITDDGQLRIYQTDTGGMFVHSGVLKRNALSKMVYIMMEEIETNDASRAYELSYVRPDGSGVLGSFSFCHEGPRYSVTWKDDDGNILESDTVAHGTMPNYNGTTPTKAADDQNCYVFSGWMPAIAAVTNDITYTAAFAPNNHNWDTPTYTWAADNSSVTAMRTCRNNENHIETETVNTFSEVTKEASCDDRGETTYTATFTNNAFEMQTKSLENIDALTHDWDEWKVTKPATETEDGEMERVCKHNANHIETKIIPAEGVSYKIIVTDGKADPNTAKKGEIITLTADEKDGQTFKEWSVIMGAAVLADKTNAITTFNMPEENVEIRAVYSVLIGDVNNDGAVDHHDKVILNRYFAGWEGYDKLILNWDAADVDRNGNVNAKDKTILNRYLANWEGYDIYFAN